MRSILYFCVMATLLLCQIQKISSAEDGAPVENGTNPTPDADQGRNISSTMTSTLSTTDNSSSTEADDDDDDDDDEWKAMLELFAAISPNASVGIVERELEIRKQRIRFGWH